MGGGSTGRRIDGCRIRPISVFLGSTDLGCRIRPISVFRRNDGSRMPHTTNSTKTLDFGGFDSSIILVLRGEIVMSIGNCLEDLSQAILVGMILVGRLGVGGSRGGESQRGGRRNEVAGVRGGLHGVSGWRKESQIGCSGMWCFRMRGLKMLVKTPQLYQV